MKPVISTSFYGGKYNLTESLDRISKFWDGHVELGWVNAAPDLSVIQEYNFEGYVMHNYFPPPPEPFLLNIISADEHVRKKSLEFVKNNLILCNKYGIEQYHVHGGYLADGKVTKDGIIFETEPLPQEKIDSRVLDSLSTLDGYAKEYGVDLAVENNTSANVAMGDVSKFVVLTEANSFEKYWEAMENIGILLDFGHLKVTAGRLKLDLDQQIATFKKLPVHALHIHDNEGLEDQHLGISKESWFIKYANNSTFPQSRFIINEAHLSDNEIDSQVNLMTSLW